LLPSAHVARPPETQEVCPGVQLLVHVKAHEALGGTPVHDWGLEHVDVEATYGQLFASTAHLASVVPFSQTDPSCVHWFEVQAHIAVPPLAVQASWGPQVVVVTHPEHPLDWISHVCTTPGPHSVTPTVHAFVHVKAHEALGADPVQDSGLVHVNVEAR
jgi:hypothetical protein